MEASAPWNVLPMQGWSEIIPEREFYRLFSDPLKWVDPDKQTQSHIYADSIDLTAAAHPAATAYSVITTNDGFYFKLEKIRVIWDFDSINDLSFKLYQQAQSLEIISDPEPQIILPLNFVEFTSPAGLAIYRESTPLNILYLPKQILRLEISGYNGVTPARVDIAFIGTWIPTDLRKV